ncbi:MAG: hypothetical protein GF346_04785, partial [Candidatus Eisenbacteria bacterium]|nr:hypothetical protein [Candidatus Latescibacterota bacterium]MBD3301742.1 hypothetical protein [Candidatus Eisenbacteria bacterium]
MRFLLWIGAGALLLLLGGISSTRGFGRATFWLLVGSAGLGLCCVFLGVLSFSEPPFSDALWIRLLWSTAAWSGPAWVAFSLHFARPERTKPGDFQRLLLFLLWAGAVAILIGGLARAPIDVLRPEEGGPYLRLHSPLGRLFVVHALAAVALLLWNLHATLETARAIGRRRTAQAIYALLPVMIAALYTLAELLIYGALEISSGDLLVGATLVSTLGFAVTIRRTPLRQLGLPAGQVPRPSSAVLSGLGAFFVGLALLAEAIRWVGRPAGVLWYERVTVALLVVILVLWIFPGLREELQRLLDRGGLVSFSARRNVSAQIAQAVAPADRPADLAIALRALLRERFGPISVHLWVSGPLTDGFEPTEPDGAAHLGMEHPLVAELERRSGALVLSGDATRMREIPLYVACEEIAERHGLRVLIPIRHQGSLIAILGVGGTEGRTLHPEDIDLLEELAAQIVPAVLGIVLEERADAIGRERGTATADTVPTTGAEWLEGLLRDVTGDDRNDLLKLRISGGERFRRTPGFADPLLRTLLRNAAGDSPDGEAAREMTVDLLPRDRLRLVLPNGSGRIVIRLVDPSGLSNRTAGRRRPAVPERTRHAEPEIHRITPPAPQESLERSRVALVTLGAAGIAFLLGLALPFFGYNLQWAPHRLFKMVLAAAALATVLVRPPWMP